MLLLAEPTDMVDTDVIREIPNRAARISAIAALQKRAIIGREGDPARGLEAHDFPVSLGRFFVFDVLQERVEFHTLCNFDSPMAARHRRPNCSSASLKRRSVERWIRLYRAPLYSQTATGH